MAARSASCSSTKCARERPRSRSSIRTRNRAPAERANSHASRAVRRLPRCSVPVGLGAKRPSAAKGEGQLVGDVGQPRGVAVALAVEQLDRPRPLDPDVGIGERDPALGGRVVVVGALVDEIGLVRQDAEAVAEADRDPQLAPVDVVELERLPLPERRRAAPQVDRDVEHAPARDPHELALAGVGLEVDAAQRASPRARLVVLDEGGRHTVPRPRVLAIGLDEEAALVAVHGGREQDEPVEPGGEAFHDRAQVTREESERTASNRGSHMPRTATMPPAAQGHQTLSAYISSRFDEFSRSQKDVAQYVVDHLDEVAFHTAEELARRANTSSSTVVRFSQALGFEGFPELQEAARDEYRHHHRSTQKPELATPLFSLDQSPFEQAVAADHVNVEDTARRVSRSEGDAAIEMVAGADRILIAGTDQMAFFASYLRHLLMLLDVRAEIAASPSQEALSRLGRIDERTLVVGLSAGRPHPLVVRAMKIARHRRARTLAIVDATLSEVAKLSERTLYYSSNSPAFVRSHAGLLSLLQALAFGVYSRDSAQYDDRVRAFKLK